MNYLEALQTLAKYTDPQNADAYDAHIRAIGIIMEVLTLGLFASFGVVAIKKVVLRAGAVKQRMATCLSSRFSPSRDEGTAETESSATGEVEFMEDADSDGHPNTFVKSPPMTNTSSATTAGLELTQV